MGAGVRLGGHNVDGYQYGVNNEVRSLLAGASPASDMLIHQRVTAHKAVDVSLKSVPVVMGVVMYHAPRRLKATCTTPPK